MDKMDMFQSKFGKMDQFGWWDLEIISAYAGNHFYLDGVQRVMSNLWSSFNVSGTGTSRDEQTS